MVGEDLEAQHSQVLTQNLLVGSDRVSNNAYFQSCQEPLQLSHRCLQCVGKFLDTVIQSGIYSSIYLML
jgi:hypothetical protein